MYFLIHCDEDGHISVKAYEKDALLKTIADEDYQPSITFFFDKMPENSPEYWEKSLIIKGEVVVPKAIEVVKEYDI